MESARTGAGKQGALSPKGIISVGIVFFIIISIIAAFICQYRLENETNSILNRQRELQQAVLEKAGDAIRVWQTELTNQAKYISSSEMFRLFITDAKNLSPEEMENLSTPDALHSHNETVRAMAEQRAYLQDLLSNFVKRRAWTEARITTPGGVDLVAKDFALPLNVEQTRLIKEAVESGTQTFGPIRNSDNGLVMDMADPLFDVLGTGESKCVAALLLSVPMNQPLLTFLSNSGQQRDVINTRLVDFSMGEKNVIHLNGTHPILQILNINDPEGSLPFKQRRGLTMPEEVYSLGVGVPLLKWQLVVETPASLMQARIDAQRWQIYSLGVLFSLGLAFLGAFTWAAATSRKRKARVAQLEKLNSTIHQQKLLLDGINSSLDTGLLLVDENGIVKVANDAFKKIAQTDKDLEQATLVSMLHTDAAVKIGAAMAKVARENKDDTLEVEMPDKNGNARLYRISLFPYVAREGESCSSGQGCVGVFQDITEFRQRAKIAQQRQRALLEAMDRAMESVDPNLVGDSGKMARLGTLIGREMNMQPEELETIQIAALLSQIGKLFVPRELLQKTAKLTPEEKREVARAPEHADRILKDMHFDLPVRETIRELNEKMDGSGPFGMKGDEISKCGRVLALANAFIGMTNFRAWRSTRPDTPAEAVKKLGREESKFDLSALKALQKLDIKEIMEALSGNQILGKA